MDLTSRTNQIIENVDYVGNDLDENILPKVRELQDLSDQGMTPIANIGKCQLLSALKVFFNSLAL